MSPNGRIGYEVELLAPRGLSRRTLAEDLAARTGGRVRPVWHRDSEPSLVPGLGRFLTLTLGFEILRHSGQPLCTLVDDVTITADLDARARPATGWHRLLTDDPRLLGLIARHSDPGAPAATALDQVAALWGATVEHLGDVHRLGDADGATLALAAPLGGERERPCEVVTPPLTNGHQDALEEMLGPARELGFTVPHEAAVHLHLDGGPFRAAHALANVVRLFAHWREPLRELLGTNPACRRLAPLPDVLVRAADAGAPLDSLREAARSGALTKFYDVNLTQLLSDSPIRDTLEVRILPGLADGAEIVARAGLIEDLLRRCRRPEPFPLPGGATDLRTLAGG